MVELQVVITLKNNTLYSSFVCAARFENFTWYPVLASFDNCKFLILIRKQLHKTNGFILYTFQNKVTFQTFLGVHYYKLTATQSKLAIVYGISLHGDHFNLCDLVKYLYTTDR